MKKKRIRKFPLILMLVAGSFTSIMTYYFQYEIKTALLVLLSVLLIFYLLGLFLANVIESFDKKNEEERIQREKSEKEQEEKKQVEKEQKEVVISEKDNTREKKIVT